MVDQPSDFARDLTSLSTRTMEDYNSVALSFFAYFSKWGRMLPLVSVIIPAHNSALYLEECVSSVFDADWNHIEVICIDDGSTDDTAQVAQRCVDGHRGEMQILVQNQRGAGAARNLGIEKARGEYLLFLDSDDFLAPSAIRQMYLKAVEDDADIVLFGGRRYNDAKGQLEDKREFLRADLMPKGTPFSFANVSKNLFQITNPAPWSKLYRKSFVRDNGIQFQELPNSNDVYFSIATLSVAQRITYLNQDFIRYRVNTGVSTQDTKAAHPLCFLDALRAGGMWLKEHNAEEELGTSFLAMFFSMSRYNIETVESPKSRHEILDALGDFPAYRWALNNEGRLPLQLRTNFEFTKAAVMQNEHQKRYIAPNEPRCLLLGQVRKCAVSVVIPVYNAARYIDETLNSVMLQSLADIEIICINDGSTDSSLEILLERAQQDERISVYDQQNYGQGRARNVGLKKAVGDYVYFMDSDDLLDHEALSVLYGTAIKRDLDLLLFDADALYESEELAISYPSFRTVYARRREYGEVYDGPCLMASLKKAGEYLQSPCLFLTKRSFLTDRGILFPEGVLHEDNSFTFEVMLKAARASHVQRRLFLRRVRAGSTMTTPPSFLKAYGYFYCFELMHSLLFSQKSCIREDHWPIIQSIVFQVLKNSRDVFSNLRAGEDGAEAALWDDRIAFKYAVSEPSKAISKFKKKAQSNSNSAKELRKIHNSRSFKIAQKLSRLYKKMKGAVGR